jgi:phage tail-like protein
MQTIENSRSSPKPAPDGIEVNVFPEFSTHELFPAVKADGFEPFRPLWHRSATKKGPAVTVASIDGAAHKVNLRIQGASLDWRQSWTKWSLRKRKARELEGGVALEEQDDVSTDGQTLTAMILPGESRIFAIEIVAEVDEATQPGTYSFDVVVEDANNRNIELMRYPAFLTLAHPRSKLLDQMPSVYLEEMEKLRDDEEGRSPFFERFLLGFEDARRPLQRTLDNLNQLFGPYSAPSEFLLWLGAWVCVPMDENWSEMKRRRLVSEAVELYRWQGTKRGLSRYLEIYTGVVPEINDVPVKGMRLGPETKMGGPTTILGDVPDHTFVVTIAVPDPSAINEQVVNDIIAFEKPAHTAYSLRIVKRTA